MAQFGPFDPTNPAASAALQSAPVRQNLQAIGDALLNATAKAQASPDLTVAIHAFEYRKADGVTRASYAGGNSPSLTAPGAGNPRISVLLFDPVAVTFAWVNGSQAATPAPPAYTAGTIPIVEVYVRAGATAIKDADDSVQAYLLRQCPWIVPIPISSVVPRGQCRLTKSGSNLLLSPFQGNLLTINSADVAIPDAGVTLSTGGLAASTTYYIYAYLSSGTLTLEASTTAPAAQAGTGIQIKTGDATRTLVGMARTTSGTAWADSVTQRLVLSFFNRRGIAGLSSYSANRTTTSTTYAEPNTEIRIEFLTWGDESVQVDATPETTVSATSTWACSLGFDGTTAEDVIMGRLSTGTQSVYYAAALALHKSGLSEGYHYVTLLGKVSTGTLTFTGSGTAGTRSAMSLMVRG